LCALWLAFAHFPTLKKGGIPDHCRGTEIRYDRGGLCETHKSYNTQYNRRDCVLGGNGDKNEKLWSLLTFPLISVTR
jgi:hypothetical protein